MAAVTVAQAKQQGSILIVVLAALAVSSLALADHLQEKQRRLHSELERTHLAELQVVANSVFAQVGQRLEQSEHDLPEWPIHWQVPQGIEPRVQLIQEACPNEHPLQEKGRCYKVELTLYGRSGTRLQRSQRYWGDPACGGAWLEESWPHELGYE